MKPHRANLSHPLQFMIKMESTVALWQIPSAQDPNATFAQKRLCPPTRLGIAKLDVLVLNDAQWVEDGRPHYTIQVEKTSQALELDQPRQITISTVSPSALRFYLADGDAQYLLTVRNTSTAVCSLVLVKGEAGAGLCPSPDTDPKLFSSKHQTMLEQSTIVIGPAQFPDTSFVDISLIVKTDDEGCYSLDWPRPAESSAARNMSVIIHVTKVRSELVVESVWILVALYLISFTPILFLLLWDYRRGVPSKKCPSSSAQCCPTEKKTTGDNTDVEMSLCPQHLDLPDSGTDECDSVPLPSTAIDQTDRAAQVLPFHNLDPCVINIAISESGCNVHKSLGDKTEAYELIHRPSSADQNPNCDLKRSEVDDNTGDTTITSSLERSSYDEKFDSKVVSAGGKTNILIGDTDHSSLKLRYNKEINEVYDSKEIMKNQMINKINSVRRRKKKANKFDPVLSDMCFDFYDPKAFEHSIFLRSTSYLWLTILMGVFYILPVFQLMLQEQWTSLHTGNLDKCYFNFQCMHPYMALEDFNHVFSNVGYVFSGLVFVVVVWSRSKRSTSRLCTCVNLAEPSHPTNCGIPEQYGIFYAMGWALILQGALSACYHICPTAKNFQFDTTFMYLMAVLLFQKVYQFRHPDITHTSHLVFLLLGIALIFEVVGYYTTHIIFWILFVVIYIILLTLIVVHIYSNGKGPSIRKKCREGIRCLEFIPSCPNFLSWNFLPSCAVFVVNLLMAAYFITVQKPGVSRYILLITIGNMILYIIYYICNKIYLRFRPEERIVEEQIEVTTWLYGGVSLLFMLGALWFFKAELKSSARPPALSRNLNQKCVTKIFDNHDMWHLLSAQGLFYTFMFILTMEDNNIGVPRDKIPVF